MRAPQSSRRRSALASATPGVVALAAAAFVAAVPLLGGCDRAATADQQLRTAANDARNKKPDVPTAPPTTQGSDAQVSPQTLEAMAALAKIDPNDPRQQQDVATEISRMPQADFKAIVAAYNQAELAERQAFISSMTAATATTSASPTAKLDALLWLAQMETAAADHMMRDVDAAELAAARLTGEIRTLAAQVQNNNALIAAYRKLEPTGARTYAEAQKKSLAGADPSAVWTIGKDNAPAGPSQAALSAQIEQLSGQIQKLQGERDAADKKRADSAAQAQQLTDQAKNAKGKSGLDMLLKAADLRLESRKALTEVEKLDNQLARLKQEQKLAETRQAESAKATQAVDARGAQIEEHWKLTQARIQAYTDHSKRLLDASSAGAAPALPAAAVPPVSPAAAPVAPAAPAAPEAPAAPAAPVAPEAPVAPTAPAPDAPAAPGTPGAPGTPTAPRAAATTRPVSADEIAAAVRRNDITARAAEMAGLVADADAKRKQALELYDSARKHTEEAQGLAAGVVGDLSKSVSERGQGVEAPAWRMTMESLAPEGFKLRLARIHEKIGRVHADQMAGMVLRNAQRAALTPVIQTAGLTMPAPIAGLPQGDQVNQARAAADAAFEQAKTLLDQVTQAGQNSQLAKQARLAQAMLAASRARFYERVGDAGAGQTQWQAAVSEMNALKAEDAALGDSNQPLPGYVSYLPADLARAIGRDLPTGTTLPAFGPTTGPATAPAAPTTAVPGVPTVPEVPTIPQAPAPGVPPVPPADPSAPPAPPADPSAPPAPPPDPAAAPAPGTPAAPSPEPGAATQPTTPPAPPAPPTGSRTGY